MSPLKSIGLPALVFLLLGLTTAYSQIKTQFGDWQTTCEASGSCTAAVTHWGSPASETQYRLEIARQHGPNAFWTMSFIILGGEARTYEPFHISVDFEEPIKLEPDEGYQVAARPNTFNIVGADQANLLMQLFSHGNETFFNYLNGRGQETAARFSLIGLTASLLWIDEQQNRLNSPRTIDGKKTVNARAPRENTAPLAPEKIPPTIAKLHFADGTCVSRKHQPLAGFGFETAEIDPGLALYLIPCFSGAYNIVYRLYLETTDKGAPKQLLFANYSDELGWSGTGDLMNIEFNPDTKTLTTFSKGGGLADCGSTSVHRWQNYAFKLVEYRYWGDCGGTKLPEDWPIIYQAGE